ncbi:MAG: copper-translocating P-type ATPase [Bacteroidales bacterium]
MRYICDGMKKNTETHTLPVLGMGCAACAVNVENAVKRQRGVTAASVNYAAGVLTVAFRPTVVSLQGIQTAVKAAGYDLITEEADADAVRDAAEQKHYRNLKQRTAGAWLLTIPLLLYAMAFMHSPCAHWIMMVLSLAILTLCGYSFYINGMRNALHGTPNMDTLVALSTAIAFLFSLFNTLYPQFWMRQGLEAHVYYEAAGGVVAFVLLGKTLEAKAKNGTLSAIRGLMSLQPKTARRLADGKEEEVAVAVLRIGDVISVRPGERVPVDGVVENGFSSVDESLLSGEALPVEKGRGDKIWAGSINQKGAFTLKAVGTGKATALAQIIRMVQEAQGSKAPVQRRVDRISRFFVPAVAAASALTFIVWLMAGGLHCFPHALLSAVSVLVIACPCALGLAVPAALTVGIGKAARQHILIKDAFALENLCKIDTVVLDKTGTLTAGVPEVNGAYWVTESDSRYLNILYTAETKSEHPLASAVTRWAKAAGASLLEPDGFESVPGYGVRINMGKKIYWAGNRRLLAAFRAAVPPEADELLSQWEQKGNGIIYYGCGQALLAVLAVSDAIKPTSLPAVEGLKSMGIDLRLLTGDTARSAAAVAERLNIDCVAAGVLPGDKENYIKALQAAGRKVAMVGDGINDSPALAAADVSIAMGKGADIAMNVAMVTLMTADLTALPLAIRLSKQTVRLLKQNLFWAFVFNLVGIPLAAGVLFPVNGLLLNPMIAGAAMAFSSVAVVCNSLRLQLTS